MKVPLLDTWAQNGPLAEELTDAFRRVLESGQYIMGEEVSAFESEIAGFCEIPHALACSSGTDALLLALMSLDIGPGDDVLVPSFTFFATAGCVRRLGARPIFVDVCPVCFNMDPDDLEAKITPCSKAVIPVHLFGQCAEMDRILDIARQHDLKVIEDAAQALGARYKDRQAGSMGDIGIFSFFPSKNLGALGDAGLLVTKDPSLYEKTRILRVHGMEPKYHHPFVGGNFRADPLQCAFLRIKLRRYEEYCRKRSANAAYYLGEFSQMAGVSLPGEEHCLCRQNGLDFPSPALIPPLAYSHNTVIWNQFTVRLPSPQGANRRDAFRAHLLREGIASEVYYPIPLHQQACFADTQPQACPVSTKLASEVLSLPVYPELREPQLRSVIQSTQTFLSHESD